LLQSKTSTGGEQDSVAPQGAAIVLKRDEMRISSRFSSLLGMIFSENRFTLFRIMP
jgi:hypothetical protein